jgi:hypothetical protein
MKYAINHDVRVVVEYTRYEGWGGVYHLTGGRRWLSTTRDRWPKISYEEYQMYIVDGYTRVR